MEVLLALVSAVVLNIVLHLVDVEYILKKKTLKYTTVFVRNRVTIELRNNIDVY